MPLKSKDDIYITALKYGKEMIRDGVDGDSLKSYLENSGCGFNNNGSDIHVFSHIWGKLFIQKGTDSVKRILSSEGYFQLLEHTELEEARKASSDAMQAAKKATNYAKYAMIISAAIGIASLIVSIKSNGPITIDEAQFQKVVQTISEYKNKLDYVNK